MADQEEHKPMEPPKKKGFWAGLSLFQKIGIGITFILVVLLIWNAVSGGINSFYELIFVVVAAIVLMVFLYVLILAAEKIFQPSYYSPKEDWFTRITNMAIDYKRDNLNNLYFMGDKDHRMVFGGKILGCIGIPYLIGHPKIDKNGKWEYYESKLLKMKIPRYEKIELGKDGDTLFIYEKGWWIFKRRHYLRCNRELHSELNGDVWIKDINPVPFGKFWEYPFRQIQQEVGRVMIQSQMEVILATHEHQGDLISQAADAGIYANAEFKMIKEKSNEIAKE